MIVRRSAVLLQFCLAWTAAAGSGGPAYLCPAPGSTMIPVNSSIAIRTGRWFTGNHPPGEISFTASGARSGLHPGRVALSDDHRTFVFYPATPFASGETVGVCVTGEGGPEDTLRYSFRTKPGIADAGPVPPPRESAGGFHFRASLPDSLPGDFPHISVSVNTTGSPLSLFLSDFPFDPAARYTPYLLILSPDGTPAFMRRMSHDCFDFKEQPNGLMTYHDQASGCFMAMDSTFTIVDSFKCGNGYPTDVHELRLLSDGHALILGYDPEHIRMDSVVQGGDSAARVYGLILQELDRTKNVVFQWRSWDHFRITDAIGVDFTAPVVDYAHGNAIELDTDSNIVLSSRHLSEITKIDRRTGEIIWRWGGTNNQFRFIGDSAGFSYQHDIRRLPGGHWTLFDNGNYNSPRISRAVEYVLDETEKTATLLWQYRHAPDLFSEALGSVQRMEDGSTLIGWGATNPSVTLVDRQGRTTLELSLPDGIFSYRAFGVARPAVTSSPRAGDDLPRTVTLGQNFPNPFNPATVLRYELPSGGKIRLGIYDVLGREVALLADGFQPSGAHAVSWNAANVASGSYFCRLRGEGFSRTVKMLLIR